MHHFLFSLRMTSDYWITWWCWHSEGLSIAHLQPVQSWIVLWWWWLIAKSCLTLATPWIMSCQAPLSMGFSRQESWSGLPFPSPGDLPDPGVEPTSPALAGGFFTTEPRGEPSIPLPHLYILFICLFLPFLKLDYSFFARMWWIGRLGLTYILTAIFGYLFLARALQELSTCTSSLSVIILHVSKLQVCWY